MMRAPLATTTSPLHRARMQCPPPAPLSLSRPRLLTCLDQGRRLPLTLVVAPAGFGKTTLLAEWAASQPSSVVWLSVDESDRDLSRFVADLCMALEAPFTPLSSAALARMRQWPSAPARETGATFAATLHELDADVVLVVDDFHRAASLPVEEFLRGLLQVPVPRFHLMLGTRGDPALPLRRWRLDGRIAEIRASDLQCTDAEALALLDEIAPAPDNALLVPSLQQQMEGWMAGLRMAAMALRGGAGRDRITPHCTIEPGVLALLAEEVLDQQTADVQDFLLRTALPDAFSIGLAGVLLDETSADLCQAHVDALFRHGLFLERTEGDWFRYHPLFLTLLRQQGLRRLSDTARNALHARTSAWFAEQGMVEEAIRYRLASHDPPGAAALVEAQVHPALNRGDRRLIAAWLELLPDTLLWSSPWLLLARGWVSDLAGHFASRTHLLATAERLMEHTALEPLERRALQGEIATQRVSNLALIEIDPEATLALAQQALADTPDEHRFVAGIATQIIGCALQTLGRTAEAVQWLTEAATRDEERVDVKLMQALSALTYIHLQAGNAPAGEHVARHLLALTERHDLLGYAAWAHRTLGWNAYERNDLAMAVPHFAAILDDSRRVHLSAACEAAFGLALAYQAQGAGAEADRVLQRLDAIILELNALEYQPIIRGFHARLSLLRGRPEPALVWLRSDDIGLMGVTMHSKEHTLTTRIKVQLAEGSPECLADAERSVEDLIAFAASRHFPMRQAELLALAALVYEARDKPEAAVAAMARSVALASAMGLRRTYLDLGPAVVPHLRQVAAQTPPTPYLEGLLDAFRNAASQAGNAAVLPDARAARMRSRRIRPRQ